MGAHPISSLVFSLCGLSSWEIRTCRMSGLWSPVGPHGCLAAATQLHAPRNCHGPLEARPWECLHPRRLIESSGNSFLPLIWGLEAASGKCSGVLLTSPEYIMEKAKLLQPRAGPSGWPRGLRLWEGAWSSDEASRSLQAAFHEKWVLGEQTWSQWSSARSIYWRPVFPEVVLVQWFSKVC